MERFRLYTIILGFNLYLTLKFVWSHYKQCRKKYVTNKQNMCNQDLRNTTWCTTSSVFCFLWGYNTLNHCLHLFTIPIIDQLHAACYHTIHLLKEIGQSLAFKTNCKVTKTFRGRVKDLGSGVHWLMLFGCILFILEVCKMLLKSCVSVQVRISDNLRPYGH